MSANKYCPDPDYCTYSDCPTAFCDRNAEHSLAPAQCSAKPSCAERERRRNRIGGIYVESDSCSDNVAIALMCYFTHHMDNPADGQEDENGNDLWASKKTDEALERIADSVWPNASS